MRRRVAKAGRLGTDGDILRVGKRLRSLRAARGLSLTEMKARSGLAIGTISQIERGLYPPSKRTASVLMATLGLPIEWLFDGPQTPAEGGILRRSGQGRRIELEKDIVKELLNPDLGGTLELLLVTIGPHGTSGEIQYSHAGEEAGYVLSGELELFVEDQRFLLGPGDSFSFSSVRPHRFGNGGATETIVIWAITPPLYQGTTSADAS